MANLLSTLNFFISNWRLDEPHLFTWFDGEMVGVGLNHLVVDQDGGVVGDVRQVAIANKDQLLISLPALLGCKKKKQKCRRKENQ